MTPESQNAQAPALAALARIRFSPLLSEAEIKLLYTAPVGEFAVCGPNRDGSYSESKPSEGHEWPEDRQIRAKLIRWICTDPDAKGMIDPRGIQIYGAQISDTLDLSFVTLPFPLRFWNCHLTEGLNLHGADMREIDLRGTWLSYFDADGSTVTLGVFFRSGFRADGEVRFVGSRIGGNIEFDGSVIHNPIRSGIEGTGNALNADGAVVGGDVYLRTGFQADGEVRFPGARIGGDLDCTGGTFQNPARPGVEGSGIALNVDGAVITGNVLLQRKFNSEGEVRLLNTQIGGDLFCGGAIFRNPLAENTNDAKPALTADGIVVKGNVSLVEGFRSEGTVWLPGAQVAGDFDCAGGTFHNPPRQGIKGTGDALNAVRTVVKGSVFLSEGFRSDGEVQLIGTQIGVDLDCSGGTFQNPAQPGVKGTGDALILDGVVVNRNVSLRDKFHSEGQVRLPNAQIGGNFFCDGGTFHNPLQPGIEGSGNALSAGRSFVKGGVFIGDGFRADGEVQLPGAKIEGDLVCRKLEIAGKFNVVGVTIRGAFVWQQLINRSETLLDLRNVSAGALYDDMNSWPSLGCLWLDGFDYGRISGGPLDATSRLSWLALQGSFTPQPYRQLAKVLRNSGDEDGAQAVLVEMQRLQRGKEWYSQPWSWLLRWSIGYGYYPLRAVGGLTVLSGLAWIIFRRASLAGVMTPTEKSTYVYFKDRTKGNGKPPLYCPDFSPFIYSLENSLPLVKLGQADLWQPDPNRHTAVRHSGKWLSWSIRHTSSGILPARIRWIQVPLRCVIHGLVRLSRLTTSPVFLRRFLWFQIILGWILATLLAAGITGIIRKD